MRPRTFILLVLVLVAAAVTILLIVFFSPRVGPLASLLGRSDEPEAVATEPAEPGEAAEPTPTPTPELQFVSVVVARADLPVGERLRPELLALEQRPETNVAVVAGVTFSDSELLDGQIVKNNISRGQEILRPMIALSPSDISNIGSDLALYIDNNEVAVAFPINRFSGAAYAMRPGDSMDAFMSLTMVDLDPEFQTELPNVLQRVDETALQEGRAFLFPPTSDGRLELIPVINTVGVIGPGSGENPIPRRVSQLTLQQMEVLWVGSWRDPSLGFQQEYDADIEVQPDPAALGEEEEPPPTPTPAPDNFRPETQPDIVILSMTSQDALTLKWAMDTGIDIDLVLRAQGDNSLFVTTSVSLPQIVEQGVLTIPEPAEVGLEPRVDLVPTPGVPPIPGQ
jgi:Flp pilus assembly protein CpaB